MMPFRAPVSMKFPFPDHFIHLIALSWAWRGVRGTR
jgi:hypothetical protein